jgi:hypothetical protein
MLVPMSSDETLFQGPMDCEIIFTDLASCPSCSGRMVWPLAKWLSPGEPRLIVESLPAGCPSVSDNEAEDPRAVA